MGFKILYVTATGSEAGAMKEVMKSIPLKEGCSKIEINLLVTGIGCVSTAWALNHWITHNGKPDLAINGGIAGSYKDELVPGDVVIPLSDCFADAGIEDGDKFFTLSEAGLTSADEFPFRNGLVYCDNRFTDKIKDILRPVRAITVNTATGSETSRLKLLKKYNPDIETMEGATFFYICAMEKIPFIALRAISNKVEARDKTKWNTALALEQLSAKLNELIIRFNCF